MPDIVFDKVRSFPQKFRHVILMTQVRQTTYIISCDVLNVEPNKAFEEVHEIFILFKVNAEGSVFAVAEY